MVDFPSSSTHWNAGTRNMAPSPRRPQWKPQSLNMWWRNYSSRKSTTSRWLPPMRREPVQQWKCQNQSNLSKNLVRSLFLQIFNVKYEKDLIMKFWSLVILWFMYMLHYWHRSPWDTYWTNQILWCSGNKPDHGMVCQQKWWWITNSELQDWVNHWQKELGDSHDLWPLYNKGQGQRPYNWPAISLQSQCCQPSWQQWTLDVRWSDAYQATRYVFVWIFDCFWC